MCTTSLSTILLLLHCVLCTITIIVHHLGSIIALCNRRRNVTGEKRDAPSIPFLPCLHYHYHTSLSVVVRLY